ncbi:DUF2946 domain-containing protein [Eleftheria terrae]|uniref:DUF2946 domain-containing protein n=1 Tax=Eleftheria terrae TaxID=1597781 RepID=UPI00263A5A73|nr:DUF2946 domain-containing protein [Eleftheria terrae]WKB53359.1 DUF2946 domain-containing protein [Eleftheria terrae]
MHRLRSSQLARLVLAWLALTLGLAIASPVLHPKAIDVVCSADGSMKLVIVGDDGETAPASVHGTLDCPLCLPAAVPLPLATMALEPAQPLAHAVHRAYAAHIAALVGAPLPPRGPPHTA